MQPSQISFTFEPLGIFNCSKPVRENQVPHEPHGNKDSSSLPPGCTGRPGGGVEPPTAHGVEGLPVQPSIIQAILNEGLPTFISQPFCRFLGTFYISDNFYDFYAFSLRFCAFFAHFSLFAHFFPRPGWPFPPEIMCFVLYR